MMRAYAWIHFAAVAKHATSEQQQALIADQMMVEFDKRFPEEAPVDENLRGKLASANELAEVLGADAHAFAEVSTLVQPVAIGKETPLETIERLVRTVKE